MRRSEAEERESAFTRGHRALGYNVCNHSTAMRADPFKMILLGDSAVGKTSLLTRFMKDEFEDNPDATIGAAYAARTVQLDGAEVKFEIWDTAGGERFRSTTRLYYRGAKAALVIYDICCHNSLEVAKSWVEELQTGESQTDPNIVIVFCGNKSDLASKRAVDVEEAQAYAEDNGLLFMETSAKSGANVNQLFTAVARKLAKNDATHKGTGVVKLENQSTPVRGGCCK